MIERALEKLGVKGRAMGTRFWAEHCPLHSDPNPAHRYKNWFCRLTGPRAGQHHCFSCKGGGTLADLVVVLLPVETGDSRDDLIAARHWLATLGEQAPAAPYLRVRFDGLRPNDFRLPPGVEHEPLPNWNSVPRAYAERRGLTAEQVERWGIGYALEGRLKGRIVFPIWDQKGRLANYTGRTFVDDPTRYMAAHERESPNLGTLYGEHLWPNRIEERGCVVVFEGAINGLAIERAAESVDLDLPLAGMSGSAFEHRKAVKLATFRRIVVATDADRAGEEAHLQIRAALEGPIDRRRCEVVRLRYDAGTDAADMKIERLAGELVRCTQRTGAAAQ